MTKRYEYWASENGKPIKKYTTWFNWDSDLEEPWQLKNKLKNEYDKEESLIVEEAFQATHKNMKK